MRELGIGLIGTGFMGRAHALAFNNARAVFELPVHLKLAALADADTERAQRCARSVSASASAASLRCTGNSNTARALLKASAWARPMKPVPIKPIPSSRIVVVLCIIVFRRRINGIKIPKFQ